MSAQDHDAQPAPPALRIVRGEPDPLELAALVAVISAAQSAGEDEGAPAAAPGSLWGSPELLLRAPLHVTGWWASSLPR